VEVIFTPRGEGWRHRGRPPRVVPDALLELLRQSYDSGEQANVPVAGSTPAEIREVVSLLRLGAERNGWRLREQHDDQMIRFYAEDRP
jgi:hypothetical protein